MLEPPGVTYGTDWLQIHGTFHILRTLFRNPQHYTLLREASEQFPLILRLDSVTAHNLIDLVDNGSHLHACAG